jgi:cell wall-associated NlpC family hydrolase
MTKNLGYSLPDPGDFEVVHIEGLGGKLIHLGEMLNGSGFADYEHARLYLGDGKCVQAEPGGATIVPFDPNDHGQWSTGLFSIPKETRKKIVEYGYKCEGVGYSAVDYFALAARRLKLGLLVPGLRTYVASSGHMICSQLVDWCYQQAGVQLFDDKRWNGYVTPTDLYELMWSRRARQRTNMAGLLISR